MTPLDAPTFAALMAPLGPFEPSPRLAVAVSGGADSLATCVLADAWARARGGDALALIVDHRLRAESGREAAETAARLAARGVAARILTLDGLARGPGLAARARAARYAALEAACAADGRLHLLLGHHAADQAETVEIRRLGGSGAFGLAGMPALAEGARVRLLRPVLPVPPGRLRATLRAAGLDWVEDPSNTDMSQLRARIRARRADPDSGAAATGVALRQAWGLGRDRAFAERGVAAVLARRVAFYPQGYAVLTPGPLPPDALSALLHAVSGEPWPVGAAAAARLAARPGAATLGGVRITPARRLGPGSWLLVREEAAMHPPMAAVPGAVWDGRFRLGPGPIPPDGMDIGALGSDAVRFRTRTGLPTAVLRTLPALRWRGMLASVPHLGYAAKIVEAPWNLRFAPGIAAGRVPFGTGSYLYANPVAEAG